MIGRRLRMPEPLSRSATGETRHDGQGERLRSRLSRLFQAFLGGADWLCVHSIDEAEALRSGGHRADLHHGPRGNSRPKRVNDPELRMVVYNLDTVQTLKQLNVSARLYSGGAGNCRQGVDQALALTLAQEIASAPILNWRRILSLCEYRGHDGPQVRKTTMNDAQTVDALREAGHDMPIRHLSIQRQPFFGPIKLSIW